MIRYDADLAAIRSAVTTIDKTWLAKAQKRTEGFIKKKKYAERKGIWSVVKPVFMKLQHDKCVFCERQYETPEYGKLEFDLEHFRPKSSIEAWPGKDQPHASYAFKTGGAAPSGYYWLAYDLLNYAASCKNCNTPLKSNYFPVAGTRGKAITNVRALSAEKPLLCYPIGDIDTPPEKLITFRATTAVPVAASGHNHRRGRVIIDFFELNLREHLHRDRARMIALLGSQLRILSDDPSDKTARTLVERIGLPQVPHAACTRAFKRLWENDQALARKILDQCLIYSVSDIGTKPPTVGN